MFVFLDLDGVMIPERPWKAPEFLDDGFPAFSPEAIDVLAALMRDFPAVKVILTTSHKGRFTGAEWMAIFSRRGIDLAALECLPENHERTSRKDEILSWIHANPLSQRFVIIDDDTSLRDLPSALKSFLIQPRPMIGLTRTELHTIRTILQDQA